jgi:enoyl-CoA hydratase/carnithine racemase
MQPLPVSTPLLQLFRDRSIGWLVLNRPERRNAINREMWAAIPAAMATLAGQDNIRSIIIRGAGEEAFASGADITEFAKSRADASAARDYEELNGLAFAAVRSAPKPVIAMIHGFCFGGGLALALACDMRLAAAGAVFSLPPARLGLAYPLDGLADLLAAVPLSVAKDMIFTARRLDATEALSAGLVNRVLPAETLEAEARALADSVAEGAPLTMRAAKAALDRLAGRPGAATAEQIAEFARQCFDSADYAEGRTAFLEKRKPVFTGR